METENSVRATKGRVQYYESAKRLLSNKIILAHILVRTVKEFQEMSPEEVAGYIEGEPLIGKAPIEPGLTNVKGERVVGLNTENSEQNEGLIRFDILFYVRMRDGLSQIIVNVEAQKDEPTNYGILNRSIFYASRLISSQKERDFANMNYDDIKQVFSIWICMNIDQNCMNNVSLANHAVLGSYLWKGRLDLINIVLIGLASEIPKYSKEYELHRLLGALLSNKMTTEEKLGILEAEYGIVEEAVRKDVNYMCNLSEAILERGIEIGKEHGIEIGKEQERSRILYELYKLYIKKKIDLDTLAVTLGISQEEALEKVKNYQQ